MDLGSASIACTAIIMAGVAVMTFFHKRRNGNPGSRALVTEKACDEHKADIDRRLGRGVERFDKIDEKLETLNKEQTEQGKVLIKVFTIVERIGNGG